MHRQEYRIEVATSGGVATFVKHAFKTYLSMPRLTLGIVMTNTTTAINEEWLTSIESMPTHKIFYAYISDIISMKCNFCVHLKKTQRENDYYISLDDFDYYVIYPDSIIKLKAIKELKKTLLHSYSEYRETNVKSIELITFSSGTVIDDVLIDRLDFLDHELFNIEYKNIKINHSTKLDTYLPLSIIAPEGNIRIFMERYSWIDFKCYVKKLIDYLINSISEKIKNFKIEEFDFTKKETLYSSAYDICSQVLFVNDVLTMCVAKYSGCDCQLNTYHKFNIEDIDVSMFHKEVNAVLKKIYNSVD
ncbi:ORF-127 [Teiidae poxvirus 1]|nr:ORF-127 [Teiidae poxvirus 1]